MSTQLVLTQTTPSTENLVLALDAKKPEYQKSGLTKKEIEYINEQLKRKNYCINLQQGSRNVFVLAIEPQKNQNLSNEAWRKAGNSITGLLNKLGISSISILNNTTFSQAGLMIAEGIALSNYQFIKYFKNSSKKANSLKQIKIVGNASLKADVDTLKTTCEALYMVRDLVNEPVMSLNAVQLAEAAVEAGKKTGFKVEVWDKKRITKENFGGLLAVNLGSKVEPRFSILEWKPANAKNKKPIVLVGKGVTYDTGGLSIKPTGDSMDHMKCDMTGAATVIGTFYAAAKTKLPLHIIGLIPSTDNRINGSEYTPGDIIKMHNGLFVEVLNTDAEGRMILADALSYASKYDPELVVDIATLTGAAARAIGPWGHAIMGNADDTVMNEFKQAGEEVYERAVELPFWDEYADRMKSSIADLKNVGGADGGAMTAGKFLEHFTNYPYIHNDIAGASFTKSEMNYRGKGGTGYGMRFLYRFLQNRAK